ncbi:endolytic transglycosylase MltG [Qipengyuania sp. JC766]|uniref:endolytic transglycosylase MltG n=1 Tax=Qipengyuania sp. JC766 TaxID=3232139 RepID=UPI0034579D97
MRRWRGAWLVVVLAALVLTGFGAIGWGWYFSSEVEEDTNFIVSSGSTLTSVARDLEEQSLIANADAFLFRAKILGGSAPVQAGEFELAAGTTPSEILDTLQYGEAVRRMVTVTPGMPSILVYEMLMGEELLTGEIPVPREGSVLPDSYAFERGEDRAAVLARMQAAMQNYMAEAWPKRQPGIAVDNIADAITLASIVEKETGAGEHRMVAGLYSNRVKKGMLLQADATIIYPITQGKPLGRRIRRSEIAAVNDYNTYSMIGLPKAPITNPGRESIAAVLDPAETSALYMVADGTGKHEFADTLAEHNANVERWYAIRRERGEM